MSTPMSALSEPPDNVLGPPESNRMTTRRAGAIRRNYQLSLLNLVKCPITHRRDIVNRPRMRLFEER